MKICVFGIPEFAFGKKALPEPRLKKIEEFYKAQKVTQIQVEFTPVKDLKTADAIICLEENRLDLLILDMEVVEHKLEKQPPEPEKPLLERSQKALEAEQPLSRAELSADEKKWLANNNFVTVKPVVFVGREEILDLPALARKAYAAADMICFLTGGPKEARAWELRRGANAVEAADAIHSDIARGFIRAEVMDYDALVAAGSVHQAKTSGVLRQEGKEYIVKDGDVMEFKFSV